jgi:coproporphyrinogen III oxidase-like Fe-S oxidoreductase
VRKDLPFEFMMNALRLNEGVARDLFFQRTGLPLQVCAQALGEAEKKGLLEDVPDLLKPSLRGQRYLNDLLVLFLP